MATKCFKRTSPKHCFSTPRARRKGFLREGGASRSESNESIAGGNRTINTSALRRELAAVSASLKPHSFPLSWRDKKGAPEGPGLYAIGANPQNHKPGCGNCSALGLVICRGNYPAFFTSFTTVPDSRNRAIRLGMTIMPLKVSAISHRSPRSMVAPTMATKE